MKKSTKVKQGRQREPFQIKPVQPGVQSKRGQPELYDELKQPCSVALTATGLAGLDAISRELKISRSQLVEKIGRGEIKIVLLEASACP